MGAYNHVEYDWVGVVYPDAGHGTFDQAELDLFDADKRFNTLNAAYAAAFSQVGNILIEVIGSWTNPDTVGNIGYLSESLSSNSTTVINVRDSARWNSVWNANCYRLLTSTNTILLWANSAGTDYIFDGLVGESLDSRVIGGGGGSFSLKLIDCIIRGGESKIAYGVYPNTYCTSVDFINTIFYNISTTSVLLASGTTGTIKHCTFYLPGSGGDYNFPITAAGVIMTNCVLYVTASAQRDPSVAVGSDYNATNKASGLIGANSIHGIADPFLDAPNNDFRINNTSPLYEAGINLAEITHDIVGVSRPQAQYHDIGAFEYDAGGQTGVPVPINLLNLVIGSRCTVEKASDGTPIVAPIEATDTSVVDSFAYISDVSVVTKVRLSSPGNPVRYRPYTAPGVITSEGLTVYVDQQVDEVLN